MHTGTQETELDFFYRKGEDGCNGTLIDLVPLSLSLHLNFVFYLAFFFLPFLNKQLQYFTLSFSHICQYFWN